MSKEEAAKKYIELGQKAIDKYGVKQKTSFPLIGSLLHTTAVID